MKYEICKQAWEAEIPVYMPMAWTDIGAYADKIVSALNIARDGVYVFLYEGEVVRGSFREWFYRTMANHKEIACPDQKKKNWTDYLKYEICKAVSEKENETPYYMPMAWTDLEDYASQIVYSLNFVEPILYSVKPNSFVILYEGEILGKD